MYFYAENTKFFISISWKKVQVIKVEVNVNVNGVKCARAYVHALSRGMAGLTNGITLYNFNISVRCFLSFCLSVFLSFCLSVFLPFCLSFCLSFFFVSLPYVFLSLFFLLFVVIFAFVLFFFLSFCLSIALSLSINICCS
jgi:hypothetical protein